MKKWTVLDSDRGISFSVNNSWLDNVKREGILSLRICRNHKGYEELIVEHPSEKRIYENHSDEWQHMTTTK